MPTPFHAISQLSNVQRNDLTGEYGCRFWNLAGEDVTITHLGMYVHSGNTQTIPVRLYSESYSLLASVSINCSTATPGQFNWVALGTPVVVSAASPRVYILAQRTAGGDLWNNAFGSSTPNNQLLIEEDIGDAVSGRYTGSTLTIDGGFYTSHGPVSFQYSTPVKTWTKVGTTYTTDGSYYQILSAINDADPGDTIYIPNGTYSWGDGGTALDINKAVEVVGQSKAGVVINMAAAAPTVTSGLVRLGAGAAIRRMTFNSSVPGHTLFTTGANSGWRISEIAFNPYINTGGYLDYGYFLYAQYAPSGLIDQCTITGGAGSHELIFCRGPNNAWQVAAPKGTAGAIFVEDCTFAGNGYVCDSNSNGSIVVRNCTIDGPIKIDAHGLASNGGPARGCRWTEAYRNRWTAVGVGSYWPCIELRGGGGRFWDNVVDDNTLAIRGKIVFDDYGIQAAWPNFGYAYQTPTYYPINDQIGVGTDPKVAASEPVYSWLNTKGGARADVSYNGNPIPAAALAQYRIETSNPSATFAYSDLIQHDRDFFQQVASFNGSSGVGVGTRAQMDAITPSRTGVGFWVTDEGSWDTTLSPNTSACLYVWSGAAWVLDYIPYTYPHPLRGGASDTTAPTPNPSTIASVTVNSPSQITVVADTAVDAISPPVEYNHSIDGTYQGWQSSATKVFTGLTQSTLYSFRVKARDAEGNETTQSSASTATTDAATATTANPLAFRSNAMLAMGAF